MDQFRLDGQVALITGGSRSLGKEMTQALAGAGADCVICSRKLAEVQAAADEIAQATGRRLVAHEVDVNSREQLEAMVTATMREFGRLDILINNAGIGMRKPIVEMEDEDWHRVLDTNLTSIFRLTRAVVPHMIARKYGRIINLSSALGSIALPGRSAYCASKGGVNQLTKVMALEWAEHNITVNAIAPGPFDTPNNRVLQQDPKVYESYLNLIPQHRWADCKEIQGLALFLASPASSFITGSTLPIDGGWTAW